jgi:hypothetical protein
VAFWLILTGGVLTVAGLAFTAWSIWRIRRAVRIDTSVRQSRRYFTVGGGEDRWVTGVAQPEPTLRERIAALEARVEAMPTEWAEAIQDRTEREAQDGPLVFVRDRLLDLDRLMSPLTREWRQAGSSVALLTLGVALQTSGSIAALYG